MGILANENAIGSGNYQVTNSLRFNASSSQYASRVYGTPTGTSWTFSCWLKRGTLGALQTLFGCRDLTAGTTSSFYFTSSDQLIIESSEVTRATSTAVFRDPAAWYHFVIVQNATTVTVYVNGVSTVSWTGVMTFFNALNITHYLGSRGGSAPYYPDGYYAEVNFIDGQALTPSAFGYTDAATGQWVAKKYTGTYGNNGSYLPFSNGTSTTTLGADSSGNGNNWTLTNFTRAAGVSDCWMEDVPSGNGSVSTQPNSNYCVISPLWINAGTVSNGNLKVSGGGNPFSGSITLPDSSKTYFEFTVGKTGGAGNGPQLGISSTTANTSTSGISQGVAYCMNGTKYIDATNSAYGSAWALNDVIGVAVDLSANTIVFYKNNVSQGSISIPTGRTYVPYIYDNNSGVGSFNFGQRSFAYTPPSGYKALCTANLPDSTIIDGTQYVDATTYTGTGAALNVVNSFGFKPDLVWVKCRSAATANYLVDSVRGATHQLICDSGNNTGDTVVAQSVTAFNLNGFSLGTDANYNTSGRTYVAWQWQAGQGTTSTNTSGTISSTVSVNQKAGFSIVKFTGTGANATVGHGLGTTPGFVAVKNYSVSNWWACWHSELTSGVYAQHFNATDAQFSAPTFWNSTAPTSTVFSVGTEVRVNGSGNSMIAYCWAEVPGFSIITSYTGNGSTTDGPFIYTGFTPKYVVIKNISAATNWPVLDTSRDPTNLTDLELNRMTSTAEFTGGAGNEPIDILSNGVKIRGGGSAGNTNGSKYLLMAFAEYPFKTSNAR